ncbi:MAG: magnesium/cobalt transporter CorA [Neisseria sp.]|uniref:magnesium/cobalt transporter CorA n=1 Tax=Neisseria sp. TaxID=192066 RepID=UPI0026DD1F80|nr:magnesium/cobalt transporter CorA [Neisseria sp.]MDO4640184.1 magnesium/cobalt transporter CorA [Neisseria sp.]
MNQDAPQRNNTENVPKQAVYQMRYNHDECICHTLIPVDGVIHSEELAPHNLDSNDTNWLHFVGINDDASLKTLLAPYGIHDLVIEDLLNRNQRPKAEDYGTYLFIVSRVFQYNSNKLVSDPVYLILGKNFVLTFQRRPLGLMDSIRKQLIGNHTGLRDQSPAFLAYTFIDRLVDDYFITFDQFNHRVESLDKTLFADNGGNTNDLLPKIHRLKRDTVRLRRTLSPMRDVLSQLLRGDFPLFKNEAHYYLLDTYDHLLQLSESLDATRDSIQSMMDIHLSFQSNRLNIQMRVLTVITILFMPLTLITGIYGMNFDNMPELHWRYGYFMVWGLIILITISLLIFFRRRKWI